MWRTRVGLSAAKNSRERNEASFQRLDMNAALQTSTASISVNAPLFHLCARLMALS